MDEQTIKRLNAINRQFYATVSADFDATRSQPWAGWRGLLPYLPNSPLNTADMQKHVPTESAQHLVENFSVLDVGCGNGRFGVFLAEHITGKIAYHGIDNNAALLERARESLSRTQNIVFLQLDNRDIVDNPPDTGIYDLIALFGVIHHIPGADNRRNLLQTLGTLVKPGGLLVFAGWRFYEYERFRERLVPFPDDLKDKIEPGDYLLDWRQGQTAARYCHYVDDDEHAALIAASGLDEIATYRADGRQGDVNRYSILQRTGH